jgi:hypothetical protein
LPSICETSKHWELDADGGSWGRGEKRWRVAMGEKQEKLAPSNAGKHI